METGRSPQSGVAIRVSMPSPNDRQCFFVLAISASDHPACSLTNSTDCTPARPAASTFSSKEPFSVQSITELVILAFGGPAGVCADAELPAARVARLFCRNDLRSIAVDSSEYHGPHETLVPSLDCAGAPSGRAGAVG